jgi:phosphatidylglycerol:prolipoprotein diacylglycerol transferase
MHPILILFPEWLPLIGGKAIHTYGAMAALGFFLGLSWIKYEANELGISQKKMSDLFFYIVVSALVGSRILFVLISVPSWWLDPLVFFRFWEGGLVFYGGFIAATLMTVFYCKKNHLSFFEVADVLMPALAIGHAVGRLGCFAAGCCYGKMVDASYWFAVQFPENSIAPHDHHVYPTQLFEFTGELILFLFLVVFRKFKKFSGEIFLLYIIVYPVLRSIIEMYRGDTVRGFVVEGLISTSQFISIIWVSIAIFLWIYLRKTQNKIRL